MHGNDKVTDVTPKTAMIEVPVSYLTILSKMVDEKLLNSYRRVRYSCDFNGYKPVSQFQG